MMFADVTVWTALVAGVLSFISPCVLPLVPAYISFMTGVSVDRLRGDGDGEGEPGAGAPVALRAGLFSLFFVLGFSVVFISLGAGAFALGRLLLEYMEILSKIGGVLIIIFGLHFMGVFRIGFLNLEARLNPDQKPPGLWGAFMIGLAFAFGWTPCVGPILAAILGLAGGQETVWQGIGLLAVYSAGLGIPFILAGLAINAFFAFFVRIRKYMHAVEVVAGLLLVAVGVLIFMGDMSRIAVMLMEWFPALAGVG
ncbi:MAG: cytochrome c biogenesis protein CcdA [Magnetococcales bacterium]|nr:cytochrome c biogenesis protein CcdA [Magnetococcales bacterium]